MNKPMPIQTVPGQGYGVAAQQQAAQRAIPVSSQPIASAPTAPKPASSVPTRQVPQQDLSVSLFHPTERPNEPITHGVDIGPGAGSEALNLPAQQQQTAAQYLTDLAASPYANDQITSLARYANLTV